MLLLHGSNHPLSSNANMERGLLYTSVHALRKHGGISIPASPRVSEAPRTELSAWLCCMQTPTSLQSVDDVVSAYHRLQLGLPLLCPFCTFPPLLMRINDEGSCTSVWTCVRQHLNTVLTRMAGVTSQTMPPSAGAKRWTVLRGNYSADNPA